MTLTLSSLNALTKRLDKLESPLDKLPNHLIWVTFAEDEAWTAEFQGQRLHRQTNETERGFKDRIAALVDFRQCPMQLVRVD